MEENRSDYDQLIAPIELRMMRMVWSVLGDADEADEALQDALVHIWRQLPKIRQAKNPHALILKICADAAYDRLRKRIRHREHYRQDLAEPASRKPSPLRVAESREAYSQIMNAIGRLSRNQAIAVMMRIVQDEPYSAIAAALNCGEASARKHVARGRVRLQQLVGHLT